VGAPTQVDEVTHLEHAHQLAVPHLALQDLGLEVVVGEHVEGLLLGDD